MKNSKKESKSSTKVNSKTAKTPSLDADFYSEINSLRMIRLNFAERQLKHLDQTAKDLLTRGLVAVSESVKDVKAHSGELKGYIKEELEKKIILLKNRINEKLPTIYDDEVDFYQGLIKKISAP